VGYLARRGGGGHNSGSSDRGVKEKRMWETLVRVWGGRGGEGEGEEGQGWLFRYES